MRFQRQAADRCCNRALLAQWRSACCSLRQPENEANTLARYHVHHSVLTWTSSTPETTCRHSSSIRTTLKMEERNIRSLFADAETARKELESCWDTNSADHQDKLNATISKYEDCLRIADQVSLFSPNETVDDIASGDIQ